MTPTIRLAEIEAIEGVLIAGQWVMLQWRAAPPVPGWGRRKGSSGQPPQPQSYQLNLTPTQALDLLGKLKLLEPDLRSRNTGG